VKRFGSLPKLPPNLRGRLFYRKFSLHCMASVALSARGLSQVPANESSNDFTFLVGDATYRCPTFVADFLSPRIAELHSVDDSIRTFSIETNDAHGLFADFLSLGRGESLALTESNRAFYISIAKELRNRELCEGIAKLVNLHLRTSRIEFASSVIWESAATQNFNLPRPISGGSHRQASTLTF